MVLGSHWNLKLNRFDFDKYYPHCPRLVVADKRSKPEDFE